MSVTAPKFAINVTSPWGSVRSLVIEVTPETTVEQLKEILKHELHLQELSELTLEVQLPGHDFGEDLVKGTMRENAISKGSKIIVVSVEAEYGTQVKASSATEVKDNTLHKLGDQSTIPPWMVHEKGVNYEAICPNEKIKTIIINRGFGTFDWATDLLHLKCPCCNGNVDPISVSKVGVNNCKWQWAGIALDGSKLGDKSETGDGIHWIIDDMVHWRKLVIQTLDNPGEFQKTEEIPEVDPTTFLCSICKNTFPIEDVRTLMDRKLCAKCDEVARIRLAEREKARTDNENQQRKKDRAEKVEKVQLIGLGDHISLKKVPQMNDDQ